MDLNEETAEQDQDAMAHFIGEHKTVSDVIFGNKASAESSKQDFQSSASSGEEATNSINVNELLGIAGGVVAHKLAQSAETKSTPAFTRNAAPHLTGQDRPNPAQHSAGRSSPSIYRQLRKLKGLGF